MKSVKRIDVHRENILYTSSCVFISSNVALTAAHSVVGADKIFVSGVKASAFHIHPEYDPEKSFYLHDLAIISFEADFSFSDITEEEFNFAHRFGHGFREGKNELRGFEVGFKKKHGTYYILEDSSSQIGDSGGGIFVDESLVAIHSTKEGGQIYCSRVSYYKSWFTPYINKLNHSWRQIG